MISRIIESNGIGITLGGIFFIFLGLIVIAVVISLFNWYFNRREEQSEPKELKKKTSTEKITDIEQISDEELAVIATAIETYRRIHFTEMLKEITFRHGDSRSPWKTSDKFSKRNV